MNMGLRIGLALGSSGGSVDYSIPGNLLTAPDDFTNGAWTPTALTVTANQTAAPDGTATADLIVPGTGLGTHLIRQGATHAASPIDFSVYYKPAGYTKITIREDYVIGQYASFDCSGIGSVIETSAGSASITAVANGFYRLVFHGTTSSANQGIALYTHDNGFVGGGPFIAFAGDGVSGGYVWRGGMVTA